MRSAFPFFRTFAFLLSVFALPAARAVGVYSSNVVISEFVASNSNGLSDENGSKEDWIELHNPTPFPVSLNGWYLTDEAANLKKWKFPNVSLPSKGYLVVFASDKNRRVAGNPLHTNFKLTTAGEYLALVKADGTTISWEYSPSFPEQLQNVSYGVTPVPGAPVSLIAQGAEAQVFIPEGPLPPMWNGEGYSPGAAWFTVHSGIGYDDTPPPVGAAKILYVGEVPASGVASAGDQSVINRLTTVLGHRVTLIDDDAVQAANAAGMDLVMVSSSVSSTAVNTKLKDVAVPGINWERGLTDDFQLSSSGSAVNLQTDIQLTTLGSTHPLGAGLAAGPLVVRQTAGTFNVASISNNAVGSKVIATASTGEPAVLVVEKGQMLRGNVPAPAARIHTFLGDDGLAPLTPEGIALFDAGVAHALAYYVPRSPYDEVIQSQIGAQMKGVSASALVRFNFMPETVNDFDSLVLKLRYDDGFVAYLNGIEVARHNAPTNLSTSSVATLHRETSAGLTAETIDISAHLSLLQAGQPNVLAFHALNHSAADDNFLLLPELIAGGEVLPYYQYYTTPTPGGANDTSTLGLVPDVVFSAERGYFTEPFSLTLSNEMSQAQIRFTTDGSAPTATTGTIYTGPISITTTAVVRAAAFRSGYSSPKPETRTFLKLDDVIRQPATIAGWPQPTIPVGVGSRIHDYEMDPEIVNDPAYAADLTEGMKEIPTMSLVVNKTDMWSATGGMGFYRNDDLKKPASIEYIDPNAPANNVQADCSVEGHSHDRMKRSLRLSFSSAYGESKFDSKLFTTGPLFPGKGNESVDKIVLRAGNNHSFARSWNPTRSTYTEDEFYRTTRVAMGGPGAPGRFVHLFINGIYWGLYNPVERPDGAFAANVLGGEKEDWFSVNHGGTHGGDATRWNYTIGELVAKNMSVPANYSELKEYVDIPSFADYLLCAWYTGMNDWPVNNWWGGNRNNPAGAFQFFNWDGEASWGTGNSSNLTAWVHPAFRVSSADLTSPSGKIWHAARVNPDFLMTVADRLYKHISTGGALSTPQVLSRWDALGNHLRKPIVAESARWGDTIQEPPVRRDVEWQAEISRIRNIIATGTVDGTGLNDNATILRNFMRGQGYYPTIDPPTFSQEGGLVPAHYALQMSNPNTGGTIYYTLDGSDPRLSGGGLSPSAQVYSSAVTIDYTLEVKARVRNGSTWSALNSRSFVSDTLPPLRVTEIMYNPAASTAAEVAQGFPEKEEFEFIEIRNIGTVGIDLSGAHFTSGLTFTFGSRIIQPGETILLVHNAAAFAVRYSSTIPVAGVYEGSLDNSGERIRLKSQAGETLIDFVYDDAWHPSTDNQGHSLVALHPDGPAELWNTAEGWRPSTHPGGSPGEEDPPPNDGGTGIMSFQQWRELHFDAAMLADPDLSGADADCDGDGTVNLLEYAFGSDPLLSNVDRLLVEEGALAVRGLSALDLDGENGRRVLFCRRKGIETKGWLLKPVFSADLSRWDEAEGEPVVVADDGEIEVISIPFPEGGDRFYFRVQVTESP
ncbi:lamin tail domain-containing protein [Luteolibacter sp. GHJ8]|uniref:Lamin tail domain-containing protein n=1 Tax=Luteolibacter rhizosphaerae TaxID=2989719 RepID=A0ABT3G7H0_9BACT|nr:lamin tail domain-containing protein [Luteolibacter rhizosphaerae]MCW1915799.1 lamin tail domain-containing protein [Luteolibacter rhizosphaerae]